MSDPNNYTIGWISALKIEFVAAQEFLEEEHDAPKVVHVNDDNHYKLGKIGGHNVVIAALPQGVNGVVAAATAVKDMMHSFPNVRVCLMVGIGGGAPSEKHDIRLGDVVVSAPSHHERSGSQGGVIQYDFKKTVQEKRFQSVRPLNQPPQALLAAVNGLSATYARKGNDIDTAVNKILQSNRRLRKAYSRPDPSSDRLYSSDPIQTSGTDGEATYALIDRPERTKDEDNPAVHHGIIASTDGFMEDAHIRDTLAKECDVLCFEMEAAGLMNNFPCLIVRGISDYSDKHWTRDWRGYAAMTAAAYANALIKTLAPNEVDGMSKIKDFIPVDFIERMGNVKAYFLGGDKKKAVAAQPLADGGEKENDDPIPEAAPGEPADLPQVETDVAKSPVETKAVYTEADMTTSPVEENAPIFAADVLGSPIEIKDSFMDGDSVVGSPRRTRASSMTADFAKSLPAVKHVYIAVMGVTGAGKSSFIKLCTGKDVKIGHDLKSCTANVEDITFMFNSRVCVHLIDTPGFDDTYRSDVQVLQDLADWFSSSFEQGTKLSGMIFLHRITDVRMTGSARRNLIMFQKLCGEKVYSSVVLGTTMWGLVDEKTGIQREKELSESDDFWGYMHKKGSHIFRLAQERLSCLRIIRHILSFDSTIVLELQDEIINRGHTIEDTKAGVQLNEDIIRERRKHQAALVALKEQMKEEMVQHDIELQRVLKEECDKLEESIRYNEAEQARLKEDLNDVRARKEREFLEFKAQMEANMEQKQEDNNRRMENFERRAKGPADLDTARMEEYENRIRLTEGLIQSLKDALEQQDKERADRENALMKEYDGKLHSIIGEISRTQKEAFEQREQELVDRENAQMEEYQKRVNSMETICRAQKEAFEQKTKELIGRENAQTKEFEKRINSMEALNRTQKETFQRQAKELADRENAQTKEYEKRIRLLEELNRTQKEAFERYAKELVSRENAQTKEYEKRTRLMEDLHRTQKETFDRREKEYADRENARMREYERRIHSIEELNHSQKEAFERQIKQLEVFEKNRAQEYEKRISFMEELNRAQMEAAGRQAREHAERESHRAQAELEKTRTKEYENRIQLMEELYRTQMETIERQAREQAERERAYYEAEIEKLRENNHTPLNDARPGGGKAAFRWGRGR